MVQAQRQQGAAPVQGQQGASAFITPDQQRVLQALGDLGGKHDLYGNAVLAGNASLPPDVVLDEVELLEEAGYVVRKKYMGADIVELTAKGRTLLRQIQR
jgi:DNA-binding MarR family transcriptional regulator